MTDNSTTDLASDLPRLQRPVRVLLCPDEPDWAFHNIARNIIRFAPEEFDISIHFMGKPGERDLTTLFETILLNDIDVVHIFWREDLFELLRPQALIHIAGQLKMGVDDVIKMISTRALTTSIYDHLHASEKAMQERATSYGLIDGYTVSSKKLLDIYSKQVVMPSPDAVTPDGVDLEFFSPASGRPSFEALTVGWVGNSGWGKSQGGDPKGYFRLFEPAILKLRSEGVIVNVELADPQVRRIPFRDMPNFYRRIDVLACTSSMEGTPNPVLEAMASGVAVVSTDVGIVPDVFGPKQLPYMLKDADVESFAAALCALARDRDLLTALKQENQQSIAAWSWQKMVQAWWPFWLEALQRARDPRMATRRHEALLQGAYAHFDFIRSEQALVKRIAKLFAGRRK